MLMFLSTKAEEPRTTLLVTCTPAAAGALTAGKLSLGAGEPQWVQLKLSLGAGETQCGCS